MSNWHTHHGSKAAMITRISPLAALNKSTLHPQKAPAPNKRHHANGCGHGRTPG